MKVCLADTFSLERTSASLGIRRVASVSKLDFWTDDEGDVFDVAASAVGDSGITTNGLNEPMTTSSSSSPTTALEPEHVLEISSENILND